MKADAIGPDFVARVADHAVLVELDGEGVVYDERTSAVHLLNPTATIIAGCLDGSSTLEVLVGELAQGFSADADGVRVDVLALVQSLGRQGLIDGIEPDDLDANDSAEAGPSDGEASDEPVAGPRYLTNPPST